MGRTKELLEQLELVTAERDVYITAVGSVMEERDMAYSVIDKLKQEANKLKGSTDVWKSRWHSLDKDFQDLVDDFHKAENENIKLHIEIESLKANQR